MEKSDPSPSSSAVILTRKLAAILSADVQGYSRLMGDNEVATITTLTTYRAVMTTFIQQHHGRVVDSPGDNLLAEFVSAVEAVQAAVAIQHALRARNTELPEQRQMRYRIGLNVGDVMEDGQRLYGDGVNIAARIESVAEGGGISISGTVYDQVKNKLALTYEDQGTHQVKNIAEPVRVYRIRVEESSSLKSSSLKSSSPESKVAKAKPRRVRSAHRAIVAGLLLLAAGVVAVRYAPVPLLATRHSSLMTQGAPALPLPNKPSIVVLPFTNMSDDPEQEYFSDGITDTLITDLSKISGLFVIARNSAFTYKGKATKAQEVGRELGVRYVLEGGVQKADERIRINVQLIDGQTGGHLWAERYDRPFQDIFALQNEIVRWIVAALKVRLEHGVQVSRTTNNLEAYDALLQGLAVFFRVTKETNEQARQHFARAIALDPTYAWAYTALGATYWIEALSQWSKDPQQSLKQAMAIARKAVTLDNASPVAHTILGQIYLWSKQYEAALAEGRKAVAFGPSEARAYAWLSQTLTAVGQYEEAITMARQAMRLNPHYDALHLNSLGQAYLGAKQYEEAITVFKEALKRNPNYWACQWGLVISYSELGQEEQARAAAAALQRMLPTFSLEVFRQMAPIQEPTLSRYVAALRKAGLK